jgi:uncharacterized alpha-E superfamily protein
MLSRTADHLYWMARYIERAENTARLLDVTSRVALLPAPPGLVEQNWTAVLSATGLHGPYLERYGGYTPESILHFMTLEVNNPASLIANLWAARENARAVRGSLTTEMWETLNDTWLEVQRTAERVLEPDGRSPFFEWVKLRAHLFHGITQGTLLTDETSDFIRLGTALERADNTARLLDVKYHILLPSVQEVGGAADYYQWGALLQALSAFENYRKVYRGAVTPLRVAELLILHDDLPRSLHACLSRTLVILERLAPGRHSAAVHHAGALHAALHYGRIDQIFSFGLHEWLSNFITRLSALGTQIGRDFIFPSAVVAV